jgi:hypoxanthine phosphoribosyltransferase
MCGMNYKLDKILISQEKIRTRVQELAGEIQADFDKNLPVFLPVLTGGFVFVSDIIRQLPVSPEVQFIKASSYGSETESSGHVKITGLDDINITDRNVLVIEDIVDTGLTMSKLIKELQIFKPKNIKVATLLDKPDRREYKFKPDYIGFEIQNHFVVGYGLDFAQKYRGLPDIWTLATSEEK